MNHATAPAWRGSVQLGPLTVGASLNVEGARVIDPQSVREIAVWIREGRSSLAQRMAFSEDFLRFTRGVGVPS